MDRFCLNFSTGTLPAGLTHRLLFVVVGCFTWVDGAFSFCDSHVALLGGNAVRARSVIEAPGAARLAFIWPTSQGSQGCYFFFFACCTGALACGLVFCF